MAKELSRGEGHNDGETAVLHIVVQLEPDEDIEDVIDAHYHATYCCHDYDCCGQWYRDRAVIGYTYPNNIVRLKQSLYRNI